MNPTKPQPPRKPRQLRSIHTKEKILVAALELFCEKGYFKTTTNEIAQRANVSIGSLYSYFNDKDAVFFEVLEKYHEKFVDVKRTILCSAELIQTDLKQWLRILIESLIQVHEESRKLNRELTVLSFYNPEVAQILDHNIKNTMHDTIGFFLSTQNDLRTNDLEAAAIVTFDLISSTVDRIVFGKNEINRDRLINTTIDMIYSYFIV